MENTAQQLIDVTREFLKEINAEYAQQAISLDASLDRDLGLGSLERAELFRRIEKKLSVKFSDEILAQTDSLQFLLKAVGMIKPGADKKIAASVPELEATHTDVSQAKTLVEVLRYYVEQEPERPHVFLQNDDGTETVLHYGELFEGAQGVARGLQARGLEPKQTVAIMLPTGLEFLFSFFGVLLAGGIPVPIYPPFRPDRLEEYTKREAGILRNAEVRFLITFARAQPLGKILKGFIPSLKGVVKVSDLLSADKKLIIPSIYKQDIAFIQYTSGSTGDPKGVQLSHFNLLSNISVYGKGVKVTAADRIVSWLPLYHDMGLIGAWLGSLYYGVPLILYSPLSFLNRPERWLWAIHHNRATLSAGPNFAYELCIRKIDDESLEGLDLSSWRLALNGAEAVYPDTIRKFTKRFQPYGFRPDAFFPAYGLAESSVALSFPEPGKLPIIDKIKREPFELEGKAIPAEEGEQSTLEFVGCGRTLEGHAIKIVDENIKTLPDRHVGMVLFKGPSAMQGYHRNAKATAAVYHDGWWDSGDYAYLSDGQLFVTGRKKDVIIKAGRNIFPPEIEDIVNNVEGVRKGCAVAFGVVDKAQGTEKLIVVAETFTRETTEREKLAVQINQAIVSAIDMPPDKVVLVVPRTIPKTSSGKLQRAATKQMYIDDKLSTAKIPLWRQFSRIFIKSKLLKIKSMIGLVGRAILTAWMVMLFLVTILPVILGLIILPQRIAAKFSRLYGKFLVFMTFCPLKIEGKENMEKDGPVVYVANHASYLDSPLLMSILPADTRFVGKQELVSAPIIKTFIKKLGYLTVDRMNFSQSLTDTEIVENCLRDGHSVCIYPEGTFVYNTGLLPFKSGAFKAAVETNTPIVPIALQGTRELLRAHTNLMRRTRLKAIVFPPIKPEDEGWTEIVRLRGEARKIIGQNTGEDTLDLITGN